MYFKSSKRLIRIFFVINSIFFFPSTFAQTIARRPLNILMVVSYFPKLSETFILNQVIGFLDLGHNVHVYAVKKEDDLVHEAFYTYKLSERVIYHDDPRAKKHDFFSQNSFDVILCHFGHRGYLGLEVKRTYKIQAPLFTIFHGVDMSTNLDANIHLYDDLFVHLDLALPISDYWKNKLLGLGYDPLKIRTHHLGVDCDKFEFKERTYNSHESVRFITVARFIEKKGVEYGLAAFAKVAQQFENVEYLIIGDGPLSNAIKELITTLGIADKVQLLGSRTQSEVIEFMKTAHMFIAPSVTGNDGDKEGIPVSMMEAMAMGLPVISTYHSGIPELVINRVTGLLADEKNVDQLAKKMMYMINHPALWPCMGKAGRERVMEKFNGLRQNEGLIEIFYEFLNMR